jgi:hypothetical protein
VTHCLSYNLGSSAHAVFLCIFLAYKYDRVVAVLLILASIFGFVAFVLILVLAIPAGASGDTAVGMIAMVCHSFLALTPLQKIVHLDSH